MADQYYTPADRWLDILNKKYPNIWAELKKRRDGVPFEAKKNERWAFIKDVPSWVEMPVCFVHYLFSTEKFREYQDKAFGDAFLIQRQYGSNNNAFREAYLKGECEVGSIAPMYLWRKSKGVYRFAPELYNELISQPLDCNLQMQSFFRLPEWAVYIETPGLKLKKRKISGFIANIDYHVNFMDKNDASPSLFLSIFFDDQWLYPDTMEMPFTNETLKDIIDKMYRIDKDMNELRADEYGDVHKSSSILPEKEDMRRILTVMLNLLMYLCSEEPDITQRTEPVSHSHHKEKGVIPKEHKVWDVGVRISQFIKKYKHTYTDSEEESETNRTVRPHIRRAHWHTYWIGPRDADYPERQAIPKWLPPIPVNVKWQDELPVNIKLVDGESE